SHRMEGLRLRRLGRGEGREVELPRVGLLGGEEVSKLLPRAELRQRLFRLLPGERFGSLPFEEIERDLLARFFERLRARRPFLFRLEHMVPAAVLEHLADLTRLDP